MLLFNSIWCCLCVSSFSLFLVIPFSCVIPDFYANIPALYSKIPCYLVFYMQYCARCVSWWDPTGGLEASLASYMFLIRKEF